MAAIRTAIRLVQQGELVGVFPEGRINTTGQLLLPGRPGAAMIALKARAPVVPCYIHGAPYDGTTLGCLLMPASVRLEIGPPIDLSAYFDRDDRREDAGRTDRSVPGGNRAGWRTVLLPELLAPEDRAARRCGTPPRRSADGPR